MGQLMFHGIFLHLCCIFFFFMFFCWFLRMFIYFFPILFQLRFCWVSLGWWHNHHETGRLVTTGSDRRGGAMCRGLQLLFFWQKKSAAALLQGIICWNVERKNKFKRFEGAVSNFFVVALPQMTIKHLLEVVTCPGVEVSWLVELSFLLVGCFEQNLHTLLKPWLVVTTAKNIQVKDSCRDKPRKPVNNVELSHSIVYISRN